MNNTHTLDEILHSVSTNGFHNSLFPESLTFNDISLVPRVVSSIKHRTECSAATDFLGIPLQLPLLAAPMPDVCGGKMAAVLAQLGALGFIHRFSSIEKQVTDALLTEKKNAIGCAIGVTGDWKERFQQLYNIGVRLFCLDIANGANHVVANAISWLRSHTNNGEIKIIAGNVAAAETFVWLAEVGADAIRVGIGNGSICTTSIETGIGQGQVSAIVECARVREERKLSTLIIADGGIRTPGDMCKALALGADATMLGSALAGTEESPGEVIKFRGQLYKRYVGAASFATKMSNDYVEGEETLVPYKSKVEKTLKRFLDGVRSSMAYMNARTLSEFRQFTSFVRLTQHSFIERTPHILG
ncbi:MAG: guanosine monophosphate reductase [Ignavibacteria bacterium]|nr:guanosine monophosphate reductase [Ignavibacteria bacterium]